MYIFYNRIIYMTFMMPMCLYRVRRWYSYRWFYRIRADSSGSTTSTTTTESPHQVCNLCYKTHDTNFYNCYFRHVTNTCYKYMLQIMCYKLCVVNGVLQVACWKLCVTNRVTGKKTARNAVQPHAFEASYRAMNSDWSFDSFLYFHIHVT